MALIVEDGTGLSTAESYVSVTDYQTYNTERGIIDAAADGPIEERLRIATEYIDIRWGAGVPGNPLDTDQALIFPTDWFTDPLPLPLLRATFEYAWYAIANSLFIDSNQVTEGGVKIRELDKVGPLMTETAWSSAGKGKTGARYPKVTKADRLMAMLSTSAQGGVIR